jgi:hypothetical protein
MEPGRPPRTTALLALAAIAAGFAVLAATGAGRRGLMAEEIQPYLPRYPRVLEHAGGGVALMPPDEPGAPGAPRWVATSQWPVLAWDSGRRIWPVLIRGHQSALGTYVGIALGPLLGGGVAGVRRSSVLLGLAIVLLTWTTARRLRPPGAGRPDAGVAPVAALAAATSLALVWVSGTGVGFELASWALMMAALALAAPARPPSGRQAVTIGAVVGLAIAARATVGVVLLPALGILLAHPARRPRALALLPGAACALAVPLGLLAVVMAIAPLRPGTTPLAGLPLAALGARTAALPSQIALQLAFIADANVVLGPLARGEGHLGAVAPFAVLGAVPVIAALVRWWRGGASDAERMLVCGMLGSTIAGAWFYASPNQFQLALAVQPLWALAVAEQLAALRALRPRLGLGALALLLVLRGAALARGLPALHHPANPMLSGRTQQAAAARLRTLGVAGPELVTTTYNQAGVIEGWTGGEIRPLHAWPVLALGRTAAAGRRDLAPDWAAILRTFRPRYVLLSEGGNLYDGPFTDNRAIAAGLARAAADAGLVATPDAHFPTDRGGPGWSLVRLDRTAATDRAEPRSDGSAGSDAP